jgi:glycosyltransferase involved in cell wall biosynthesis
MSDIKLSVLLPVYGGKKFVGRAIESVLSQSFTNFEFLILDDGTQAGTQEILWHCARQDWRIRLFRHDKRGPGYTLDRGIREARGAIVAEIGEDDVALPGRFQKQIDFLDSHADHVLVGSYLRIIDSVDRILGLQKYPTSDQQLRNLMPLYNPIGSPSVMYRRDEALAAGGYTARFRTGEYYDFILRLAWRGKVANLPEALAAYRFPERATRLRAIKEELRDALRVKRVAYSEYGYRRTLRARALNLAQAALSLLPNSVIYWLLTKEFVVDAADDGPSWNR